MLVLELSLGPTRVRRELPRHVVHRRRLVCEALPQVSVLRLEALDHRGGAVCRPPHAIVFVCKLSSCRLHLLELLEESRVLLLECNNLQRMHTQEAKLIT